MLFSRVLAHGYALNHTALSIHRLLKTNRGSPGGPSGTKRCWSLLEFSEKASAAGIVLNQEGGVIKVKALSSKSVFSIFHL